MQTTFKVKRPLNPRYVELCYKCEIPVKEALKYKFTVQDLQNMNNFKELEQRRSLNANCD